MSEWIKTSLGDTISFSSGESLPKQNWEPGSVPVYGGNGISGYHRKSNINTIRLIIGRVGEHCGNAYITEEQSWVTDNALITSFKGEIHSLDFWQYLLSSLELRKQAYSSAQPVITGGILNRINVCLPPYEQQQKIAKILSTVDNLIEKTQTLIDKYTAIKQGMMADLFTRGIDMTTGPHCGKLRPSAKDAPDLYKQTELGWVPKEWEVKPLGEYLSMITYGFTNPMPEAEDGPWMVTAANVVHGGIDYKKTRKTTLEAFNTLLTQKSRPKLNDILLTKDGTLGRLAIVDNENLCINQSVALLRCNESAKPEFLKLLLETERYYQKMLDDAGGSTIKHIYITIVDKMLLAMPLSEKEQEAIFTRANAINEKIEFEKRNSEKYKKLKKGLMQDLLTGKVKVC